MLTDDEGYEYLSDLADEEDGELELVSDWNGDESKKKYKITVDDETEYYYVDDDGEVTDEDGDVVSEDGGYEYLEELADDEDGELEDAI